MNYDFVKQEKTRESLAENKFSCMTQPIEITYNSVNNGPTITKFGRYVA